MATERRIDGETPSGGAYSITSFLDGPFGQGGQPVDEAKATHAVIREYDADGGLLRETWGTLGPPADA